MTKEDYCSYELSQLLKEKGFEGVCEYAYANKGNYFEVDRSNFDEVYCLRPTHQMAMKWLREKGIFVEVSCDTNDHFWFYATIYTKEEESWEEVEWYPSFFYNYEEAVKAALKYSLKNLI